MELVRSTLALALLASCAGQQCGAGQQAPVCDATESCCMDYKGCTGYCSECCNAMVTKCVEPRGTFITSTCCPRWTVGCTHGSVGCCDPASPWQAKPGEALELPAGFSAGRNPNAAAAALAGAGAPVADAPPAPVASSGNGSVTGYAMFTEGLTLSLKTLVFDARTGKVTGGAPLGGPAAAWYAAYIGQGTRVFPFDESRRRFIIADANASSHAPMSVYTVDAATGASTAKVVSGCAGYPAGLAWDDGAHRLIVGTQDDVTATFCSIDVDTGEGKRMGSLARGTSEANSTNYYAAYITAVSGGGQKAPGVVRVGHRLVSTGADLGLGSVGLSAGKASSRWQELKLGPAYGPPATARYFGAGLVSLAPRTAAVGTDKPGAFDVVQWSADGSMRVLANLTNANKPSLVGYVADALGGHVHASMTVAKHASPLLPGVLDNWAVSTLDLVSGALTQAPLSPQPSALGAETTTLSGFGVTFSR